MTTHNHTNNTARSAGHPSIDVLTAAEADAIVGGRFIDDLRNFAQKAYKFGKGIYEVGEKVVKFLRDLF
jgi:hypothetical protein